jgi:hypothetical protein
MRCVTEELLEPPAAGCLMNRLEVELLRVAGRLGRDWVCESPGVSKIGRKQPKTVQINHRRREDDVHWFPGLVIIDAPICIIAPRTLSSKDAHR